MEVQEQIQTYIDSLPKTTQKGILELMELAQSLSPGCKLWFLDGKNSEGKVVSNPNIGYGSCMLKYADGSSKEFYQVGLSANKSGLSVFIFGLEDRTFLPDTFGSTIGKANVSSYCIKFKTLIDIDPGILQEAMKSGFGASKPTELE